MKIFYTVPLFESAHTKMKWIVFYTIIYPFMYSIFFNLNLNSIIAIFFYSLSCIWWQTPFFLSRNIPLFAPCPTGHLQSKIWQFGTSGPHFKLWEHLLLIFTFRCLRLWPTFTFITLQFWKTSAPQNYVITEGWHNGKDTMNIFLKFACIYLQQWHHPMNPNKIYHYKVPFKCKEKLREGCISHFF